MIQLAHSLHRSHPFTQVLVMRTSGTGGFLDTLLMPHERGEATVKKIRYDPAERTLKKLPHEDKKFDLIALDPWHTFAHSQRDLAAMAARLHNRGLLLCHDCNPPKADICQPEFCHGEWCGVTYAALVAFVASRREEKWMCAVLPEDYGVAMLCKQPNEGNFPFVRALAYDKETCALRQQFLDLFHRGDHTAAFAFYQQHAAQMVNLITV